ncbi:MAG: alpha-glucan family phosphorylase [Deltaproteobacteria bacterium]|nr:alpha-glucan family phosphorylase [Deltaproteobacteria bacterium]
MSRKTSRGGDASNDGSRDLAHAIAELAHQMPAALAPLATIAYDYRWTWEPRAAALFEAIEPTTWRRTANPRYVVEVASPRRLDALAARPEYVAEVRVVADAILAGATAGPTDVKPVAYFCSEFAIHAALPIYGGGLGVLAGDLLKAAADAALPLVGVGLAYRQGYFQQRLDPGGWQHEYWVDCAFDRLPMVRVTDREGGALTVTVPIRGRDVHAQIWRLDLAHVRLYLLDTDRDDNDPIDRWITARLYVGDRHTRLTQYAMLGVGGVRALDALGIEPALVHLNEGHAAFGSYERIAARVRCGAAFDEAAAAVRDATIFTTHTPVPAGNEAYGVDELEAVLGRYFDGIAVPRERLHDLARIRPGDAGEGLGITPLALRTSRTANGVSRLHGAVARAMWQALWSDHAVEDVPIGHVTNGVHVGTWMAPAMQALLDRHLGPDWRRWHAGDAGWDGIADIPNAELWGVRSVLRAALVDYARTRSVQDRLSRGETPEYVAQAAEVFDANVLTIGFARRVATYKRLYLLARYPERNLQLLADGAMPIQLVIAGKAHPQDQDAKATLHAIFGAKAIPNVGRRVVYLENYDLAMALRLVSGVDVWLNLPRPPLEASGTSGMKVAMNGGLNLSMLDGWWAEAFDGENGWGIDSPEGDHQAQDDRDAAAVLDLVEREVRPLFYDRGPDGLPVRWLARVKHALRTLVPQFTAARMLREYDERVYGSTR